METSRAQSLLFVSIFLLLYGLNLSFSLLLLLPIILLINEKNISLINQLRVKVDMLTKKDIKICQLENSIIERENEIQKLVAENLSLKRKKHTKNFSVDELTRSPIYKKYHSAYREVKKLEFGENPVNITIADKNNLISTVETLFPDFAARILQLCPFINEDDLYLCYLHKINIVSPSFLCNLLYISDNSVTMKRVRLYRKLFGPEGNKKLFNNFIMSL